MAYQSTARYFRDKLTMRIKAKRSRHSRSRVYPLFHDADINYFADTVPTPWMPKPRARHQLPVLKKIYTKDDLWENIHDLKEDRLYFYWKDLFLDKCTIWTVYYRIAKWHFVRCSQYLAPPFEVAHGGAFSDQLP